MCAPRTWWRSDGHVWTALNMVAWHTTSSQGTPDAICSLSSLKLVVVVAVVGVIGAAIVIGVSSGKITNLG